MVSKIYSMAVNGLHGQQIEVEVDVANGLPAFIVVGLPDASIQESRERVRSAIKNSGYSFPRTKITVNLAPADIRKSGPSFDLPIALWILAQEYGFTRNIVESSIFLGELSLDGNLRPIDSILPAVLSAREKGYKYVFVPQGNLLEAALVPDIHIIAVDDITECVQILTAEKELIIAPQTDITSISDQSLDNFPDFSDVVGQEKVKRALMISAAGGHNILMEGPPGSGKTLLAKCFAKILPDMIFEEIMEVSKIYSIAGLLTKKQPLIAHRPFRKIHHTASAVSIIGGGRNSSPGEISLAHNGVLFLDEFLEFPKSVLETLRQPLEDGNITVTRVHSSFEYPARFMLVGALNPCPCGFMNDPEKSCQCTPSQIDKYRGRLSGPLLDRMDIFVQVPRVKAEDLQSTQKSATTSADIQRQVQSARDIQRARFWAETIWSNAQMSNSHIDTYCQLDTQTSDFLQSAVQRLNLSTRAYFRILKLARTIADIDGREDISFEDVAESIGYRGNE